MVSLMKKKNRSAVWNITDNISLLKTTVLSVLVLIINFKYKIRYKMRMMKRNQIKFFWWDRQSRKKYTNIAMKKKISL